MEQMFEEKKVFNPCPDCRRQFSQISVRFEDGGRLISSNIRIRASQSTLGKNRL